MKSALKTTLGALALVVVSAVSGNAAVVAVTATNTDLANFAAANPTLLPAETTNNPFAIVSGSAVNQYRSPFDNLGAGKFEDIRYFTVGSPAPNNSGSPVTLMFSGLQTSFKILWGSVDNYNTLQFYNGGTLVETAQGGGNVNPSTGRDAAIVTVTDILFDRVVFTSPTAAFEFSNISTTAVPLPAGGVLLLSAFAGFAAVRRRKSA